MQTEVQINFEHIEHDDGIEMRVREELDKLGQFCDRLTAVRVVIGKEQYRHNKGNGYSVRLALSIPAAEDIAITRDPAEPVDTRILTLQSLMRLRRHAADCGIAFTSGKDVPKETKLARVTTSSKPTSVDMPLNPPSRQIIEVRVRELSQLFNSLDPSPFPERDLDDNAAEYIVGWARELPMHAALAIAIHLLESEAREAEGRELRTALLNYFLQRAEAQQRELNEHFRIGRRYATIGLPILIVCFMSSQIVRSQPGAGPLTSTIAESLLLVGWVANCKPIETFLYDRWPLKRRRDLYYRLAAAEIIMQPA